MLYALYSAKENGGEGPSGTPTVVAGVRRNNSIMSLLSGKPTLGVLTDSPSTDRLFSLLTEQDGEKLRHVLRSADHYGAGSSGTGHGMQESLSFGQLTALHTELDELDDPKDITLNIPEDSKWDPPEHPKEQHI